MSATLLADIRHRFGDLPCIVLSDIPDDEQALESFSAAAKGASNKEIARELGISERTVKLHVGAALEKLRVHDRLQIALIVKGVYHMIPFSTAVTPLYFGTVSPSLI